MLQTTIEIAPGMIWILKTSHICELAGRLDHTQDALDRRNQAAALVEHAANYTIAGGELTDQEAAYLAQARAILAAPLAPGICSPGRNPITA